jgi:hypothetical protein
MRYLIWSAEHRGWWKGNRHGYTTRTDKAGQFTEMEARSIVMNANRHQKPGAPLEEIMLEAPSPHQLKLDLDFPDR